MKLKLTPAQAEILYRLLGETSTDIHRTAIHEDLDSDDIWTLWGQLDDKMAERGMKCLGYGQLR